MENKIVKTLEINGEKVVEIVYNPGCGFETLTRVSKHIRLCYLSKAEMIRDFLYNNLPDGLFNNRKQVLYDLVDADKRGFWRRTQGVDAVVIDNIIL